MRKKTNSARSTRYQSTPNLLQASEAIDREKRDREDRDRERENRERQDRERELREDLESGDPDGDEGDGEGVGDTKLVRNMTRTVTYGLDALINLDRIFIQKADAHTDVVSTEIPVPIDKLLRILNIAGETIFLAGELVDCGSRCWRGMQRRYSFYVFSLDGEIILTIDRQRILACDSWTCPSSLEEESRNDFTDAEILDLQDTEIMHFPTGRVYGAMKDCSSVCMPQYQIEDAHGLNLLNIRGGYGGTWCRFLTCSNSHLRLYDNHRNFIGLFQKKVILEVKGTKNLCMAANFPQELPLKVKALALAAMFEMKITFFERRLSLQEVIWAILIILILAMTAQLVLFITLFSIS